MDLRELRDVSKSTILNSWIMESDKFRQSMFQHVSVSPFYTSPTMVVMCTGRPLRQVHLYCTLMLYSICLAVTGNVISEMASKAAAAKRLQKVQRRVALEAVKMAKRERGFY